MPNISFCIAGLSMLSHAFGELQLGKLIINFATLAPTYNHNILSAIAGKSVRLRGLETDNEP